MNIQSLSLIQELKNMKQYHEYCVAKERAKQQDHRDILSMFRNSSRPSRLLYKHVCRVR